MHKTLIQLDRIWQGSGEEKKLTIPIVSSVHAPIVFINNKLLLKHLYEPNQSKIINTGMLREQTAYHHRLVPDSSRSSRSNVFVKGRGPIHE
jgi:hypothetical protein